LYASQNLLLMMSNGQRLAPNQLAVSQLAE